MSALAVTSLAAGPLMILLLFVVIGAIILMIKLFKKQPWVGAVVGVALLLGLCFFLIMPVMSYRSVEVADGGAAVQQVSRKATIGTVVLVIGAWALAGIVVLIVRVGKKQPWVAAIVGLVLLSLPVLLVLTHLVRSGTRFEYAEPEATVIVAEPQAAIQADAAIWTPGIEDVFEGASVYPSKAAAVWSLGLRIATPVSNVLGDGAAPGRVIVFRGSHDRALLDQFGNAADKALGGVQWDVEPESVAVEANEVAVRLDHVNVETEEVSWSAEKKSSGEYQAVVLGAGKEAEAVVARYVTKDWADSSLHATFVNSRPDRQYVVVKSKESCISEEEANNYAMREACREVADALEEMDGAKVNVAMRAIRITPADLLNNEMVVDRFVQSFDGSAGKIWRQAMLIDVSQWLLHQLYDSKRAEMRAVRVTWAKMLGSMAGLIALIVAVYLFLNAATKGYYAWSLRVAGVVLAGVVILFFLV